MIASSIQSAAKEWRVELLVKRSLSGKLEKDKAEEFKKVNEGSVDEGWVMQEREIRKHSPTVICLQTAQML